jgi:hypothetical protein
VPVIIAKFDARDFALAEVPGPRNNWNRLTVRSKSRRHTIVTIEWETLQ